MPDGGGEFAVGPGWRTFPLTAKHDSDVAAGTAALHESERYGLEVGDRIVLRAKDTKAAHEFAVGETRVRGAVRFAKDDFDGLGLSEGHTTVEVRRFNPRRDDLAKLRDTSVVGYLLGVLVAVVALASSRLFPPPDDGVDPEVVAGAVEGLSGALDLGEAAASLESSSAALEVVAATVIEPSVVDPDGNGPRPPVEVVPAADVEGILAGLAPVSVGIDAAEEAMAGAVVGAAGDIAELEAAAAAAKEAAEDDGRAHDRAQAVERGLALVVAIALVVLAGRKVLGRRLTS